MLNITKYLAKENAGSVTCSSFNNKFVLQLFQIVPQKNNLASSREGKTCTVLK